MSIIKSDQKIVRLRPGFTLQLPGNKRNSPDASSVQTCPIVEGAGRKRYSAIWSGAGRETWVPSHSILPSAPGPTRMLQDTKRLCVGVANARLSGK